MKEVQEISVYSEKYGIEGKIINVDGMVVKLLFEFEGRQVEMGLEICFMIKKDFEKRAVALMEGYIDRQKGQKQEQKVRMYHWYLNEINHEGKIYTVLHGNVVNHSRFTDSTFIDTSAVENYEVDWEKEELVVQTRNMLYHCPLAYCRFIKQDAFKKLLPDYERIRAAYIGKIPFPTIEPGKVLLVLSNFDDYYFHSLCYIPEGEAEPVNYSTYPHVGTYQDSFLIQTNDNEIDIRYFPHLYCIEPYMLSCNKKPCYVENIGSVDLIVNCGKYIIKVSPGERKRICKENAEKKDMILPNGDLYPAQILF